MSGPPPLIVPVIDRFTSMRKRPLLFDVEVLSRRLLHLQIEIGEHVALVAAQLQVRLGRGGQRDVDGAVHRRERHRSLRGDARRTASTRPFIEWATTEPATLFNWIESFIDDSSSSPSTSSTVIPSVHRRQFEVGLQRYFDLQIEGPAEARRRDDHLVVFLGHAEAGRLSEASETRGRVDRAVPGEIGVRAAVDGNVFPVCPFDGDLP